MMYFGNNFNFGFGYNPFSMGSYFSPNFNFFSGNYSNYLPSSSFSSYNSLFGYQSYSQYSSYNTYFNSTPYTTAMPMQYGSMLQYNMFQQPVGTYINYPFSTNYITNPISFTTQMQTSSNSQKISANEKEINKKGDDYGPEFLNKVKEISKRLNCDYKDLLGVMNSESGINAKAQNKNGGASGLIQFMPKTAEWLGTTTNELRNMSPIDQLDYVEKCITECKKMAKIPAGQKLSGGQLYALIFLPARANREVLTTSNEAYYKANKGLDANKDGRITKTELDERVARFHVSDKSFLA